MTFQIHMRFFGSFMINFGSETCIFRSMIYTDWILFSILLGHYVVQFRSETAMMRAEINDFSTSYGFFGSFMIIFVSETCTFRSLINTDWISFSILLGHNVVQFRSKTAIMRAEFDDFPTSSAFFGYYMINFVSETCTFRSLIYTNWILFSILLGRYFAQFRSETAIMRAEFNDFPTSYAFFGSFSINFRSETCNVWILDTYQLDIVVKYFGSLFCSIQIWNCHYENRIYWVFNFICIFWIFHDRFWVWKMYF